MNAGVLKRFDYFSTDDQSPLVVCAFISALKSQDEMISTIEAV